MIEIVGNNGLYVVLAIVVVAVASLFGLVVFVSKEEKFEDVVAAQKKEQEALIQSLNSTSVKPSKSKKKWQKIKKEKSAKAQEKKDEPEATEDLGPEENSISEENVIEQLAEAEIPKVEAEDVSKAPKKQKGKEKKKKQKASDETSSKKPMAAVEEQIVEAIEEVVEAVQEVPEMETVPDFTFLQETVKDVPKEKPIVQEQKQNAEASVSQKKAKSKKVKAQVQDDRDAAVKKIASDVEKAHLSNNEVQTLIDTLLDKQNELQQWQKPNQKADPIDELKKRVTDLEMQLNEEKKTSLSAVQKNKELRQEVQQEKSHLQRLQAQANQKISQQASEIQALQKRMEATQENHLRELHNSQTQVQKMKELLDQSPSDNTLYNNSSHRIQKLTEEKSALYAECGKLQQLSTTMQADLEAARANLQNYHQQQKHYEEKLHALESELNTLKHSKGDSEAAFSSRLSEVSRQLERSEAEKKTMAERLDHAQHSLAESEKSKQELVEKLKHEAQGSSDGDGSGQKLAQAQQELDRVKTELKAASDKVKHYEESEAKNSDLLKKLADEKLELEEKLKKEEIVLVEQHHANGDVADSGVSQQEHMQQITEKDKVISELKEAVKSTKEELERLAKVLEQEKHEKDENVKTLQQKVTSQEEAIAEQKAENKKLEEVVEVSKNKNNDLREKNWKAMDALSTTEANCKKKLTQSQERVLRMLKKIRPAIKLEKDKPLDDVLSFFEEEFLKTDKKRKSSDSSSSSSSDSDSDSGSKSVKKLKKENEDLLQSSKSLESELANLQKAKSALEKDLEKVSDEKEQLQKSAEESKSAAAQAQYYKGILEQTEGMLKELEVSVEKRVTSYESKLKAKEAESLQFSIKLERLEEEIKNNDDKSQLEKDLSNIQTELESEKKAKHELESELEEAKNRISSLEESIEHSLGDESIGVSQESLDTTGSSSPKKKKSIRHALSKAFRKKAESPDDVKSKLVAAEDNLKKLDSEKKELLDKLGQVSDSCKSKEAELEKLTGEKQATEKEMKKLQEKINAVKEAENGSGKSDKEKDKIIAKLRLENAELLEDLRDERDRVVVDVESADSEKLKSELETLKGDFEKEKSTSSKLNSSIQELEDKLNKKRLELEQFQQKYKDVADKLVVADQRSKELELAGLSKSERIEQEIDEAIQGENSPTSPQRGVGTPLVDQLDEIKRQLADKEKLLDTEKQVSNQLRAQVAALASNDAHGTSV